MPKKKKKRGGGKFFLWKHHRQRLKANWELLRLGLGLEGLWKSVPSLVYFIHNLNFDKKAQTYCPKSTVVSGWCLRLCLDTQMTTVNCFALGTDLGKKWHLLRLNNFGGACSSTSPRHQGRRRGRLEPGLLHSHHSWQRMTDSEWIIYFLFPHSSDQMKSSPIWREWIAQVNPRVCLGEVKHGRKVIWKACCWEIYWVQTGERWERGQIAVQKNKILKCWIL